MRDENGFECFSWVDNSVRTACNTIGCDELIEFDCGSANDVVRMLRDSSLYVYNNLATELHNKGVQTVIAFNQDVYGPASDVFQVILLQSLANGRTLGML